MFPAMRRGVLCLFLVVCGLAPVPEVRAQDATPAAEGAMVPELRPRERPENLGREVRCTEGGDHCIALDTYLDDVCGLIETASDEVGIDTGFFARLLWKESLFDATAISPAGAQGIAQFMPGTAVLRGLADPFNPAEAIFASATYLAELSERFGNLGLAAAAYNGGEARMERFLANSDTILPGETQDYVASITGHTARAWRDTPPETVDYRLDGETPFETACLTQAEGRSIREFRDPVPPWGVIVAAARRPGTAEVFAERARSDSAGILDGVEVNIVRAALPGRGSGRQYTAQVPAQSRDEARALCRRLQARGGFCLVTRN